MDGDEVIKRLKKKVKKLKSNKKEDSDE
jgi:hypothetical protein